MWVTRVDTTLGVFSDKCEAIIVEGFLGDTLVGTGEALERYPESITLERLITLDVSESERLIDVTDGELVSDGQLAHQTVATIK